MTETRTTSSTGGQKGVKLERHDLIPPRPLAELAEHYGVGASKYANHQWRQGYEWSKSYAAMVRHQNKFWAGEDYDVCSNDPEGCSHVDAEGRPFVAIREDACFNHTGSHHMAAVAWHAFLLLEFKDAHPDHDDRYKGEPETVAEEEERLLAEQAKLDEAPIEFDAETMLEPRLTLTPTWVQDYDAEQYGPDLRTKRAPVITMHHTAPPLASEAITEAINQYHNEGRRARINGGYTPPRLEM